MRNARGVTLFTVEALVTGIVVIVVGIATWVALDVAGDIGGIRTRWILRDLASSCRRVCSF